MLEFAVLRYRRKPGAIPPDKFIPALVIEQYFPVESG
jgi:hypothetical protein